MISEAEQLDNLRDRLLAWAGCDGIADIWEAAYRRYCKECVTVINGIVDGDMTKEDLDPRTLLNVFTESVDDLDALLALGKQVNNGTHHPAKH
jgi:hypothetical protein